MSYKKYTVRVYDNGTKCWYLNGKRHRENGPAIEYPGGTKEWYLNNQLHREDGPVIECTSGYKEWCLNGRLHREDGPAIEYVNGDKSWYLDGVKYTEKEFNKTINSCENKTVTIEGVEYKLVRKGKIMSYKEYTVRVHDDGCKEWFLDGQYHREDGPAVEYASGYKAWYLNNKFHREDGPAVEHFNGVKFWYLNGKRYTEEEFNKKINPCVNKIVTIEGVEYQLVKKDKS